MGHRTRKITKYWENSFGQVYATTGAVIEIKKGKECFINDKIHREQKLGRKFFYASVITGT